MISAFVFKDRYKKIREGQGRAKQGLGNIHNLPDILSQLFVGSISNILSEANETENQGNRDHFWSYVISHVYLFTLVGCHVMYGQSCA